MMKIYGPDLAPYFLSSPFLFPLPFSPVSSSRAPPAAVDFRKQMES